jgi:hypothetical protein
LEIDHDKYYSKTEKVRMGADIHPNKTLRIEKKEKLMSVAKRVNNKFQNTNSSRSKDFQTVINKAQFPYVSTSPSA